MKEVIGWLTEIRDLLAQPLPLEESDQRFATVYLATNGRWYAGLARRGSDPQIEWFGPFSSKEAAIGEFDYHSNPGGFTVDDRGAKIPPENVELPTKERPGERWW